jgi:two-component system, NtrC family, sensor kinase
MNFRNFGFGIKGGRPREQIVYLTERASGVTDARAGGVQDGTQDGPESRSDARIAAVRTSHNRESKMKFTFSIRIKLLLTMLLVVTAVVSVITFTIVTLFQKDKTTYMFDLTSVIALHMAEEANSTLLNYNEQLNVFSHALLTDEIEESKREAYVKKLFGNFEDFIAVTLYDLDGKERVSLYDTTQLSEAGVEKETFLQYRKDHPILVERYKPGEAALRNSTISSKLPSFTLSFLYQESTDGEPFVVAAEIHLKKLLALGGKSKVFDTFLVDDQGTLLSHPKVESVLRRESLAEVPVVKAFVQGKALAGTLEYSVAGQAFLGAYGRVDFGGLGAVVQIPKSVAYLTAKELINTLMVVALAVLCLSALVSLFWSRGMTRPILKLSQATRVVAGGDFNIQVDVESQDEIGRLAGSFNQMASELKSREEALKSAQSALIQSEKMAAFGQLGAGIAHEVKNPLAGILGYTQLALRKIEKESPIAKQLQIIEKETKRCKGIIENLMKFTRQEKAETAPTDLNQVVEDSVAIVDHQLTINKVKIEKALAADLPKINGNGNQLQQVLMNLMINAQQAMPEGGSVKISTQQSAGRIEIQVTDTGPGIPKEIRQKIFEPFFTTKPVGKGTGLGLSVSYGIIKDHGGQIQVQSEIGKGTTFILTFPLGGAKQKEEVLDGAETTHSRGR